MRGRPMLQLVLLGIVASVIGVAISLWVDWFPTQASAEAEQVDLLYDVLLFASVPIFVLVMAIAIYSCIKFRARPGDEHDGPPIHGNATLEVIWVTIPFILVTALAVYGWVVLEDIEAAEPDMMVVEVRGEQFAWSFIYPGEGDQPPVRSTELMLPEDRQVEFRVQTEDVIHSFWIPDFRLKTDTVPGITTTVRMTPTETGEFEVVCAELCGIGHSTMRQQVTVMPPDEFDGWLSDTREALGEDAMEELEPDVSPSGVAGQPPPEEEEAGGAPEEGAPAGGAAEGGASGEPTGGAAEGGGAAPGGEGGGAPPEGGGAAPGGEGAPSQGSGGAPAGSGAAQPEAGGGGGG